MGDSVRMCRGVGDVHGCMRVRVFVSVCGRGILLLYPCKAQQPHEQRYPFLPVCAVFLCVQTVVWLPGFEILFHGALRSQKP